MRQLATINEWAGIPPVWARERHPLSSGPTRSRAARIGSGVLPTGDPSSNNRGSSSSTTTITTAPARGGAHPFDRLLAVPDGDLRPQSLLPAVPCRPASRLQLGWNHLMGGRARGVNAMTATKTTVLSAAAVVALLMTGCGGSTSLTVSYNIDGTNASIVIQSDSSAINDLFSTAGGLGGSGGAVASGDQAQGSQLCSWSASTSSHSYQISVHATNPSGSTAQLWKSLLCNSSMEADVKSELP